jgi:hypothetical protein
MSTANPDAAQVAAQESVFEGTVLETDRNSVSLLVEGGPTELRFAPTAVLWRGRR